MSHWRRCSGLEFQDRRDRIHDRYFPVFRLASIGSLWVGGRFDDGRDKNQTFTGTAYHNHNWGDAPMDKLMHDWYWGRAPVGPYSLTASYITATGTYNGTKMPSFLLAKDGKVLADHFDKVYFSAIDININQKTGKPVAKILRTLDELCQRLKKQLPALTEGPRLGALRAWTASGASSRIW